MWFDGNQESRKNNREYLTLDDAIKDMLENDYIVYEFDSLKEFGQWLIEYSSAY